MKISNQSLSAMWRKYVKIFGVTAAGREASSAEEMAAFMA